MDKRIIISMVLILFLAVGCVTTPKAPKKTSLSIAGSSSGLLILDPIVKGFMDKYPGYEVKVLPGTETKDGLMGVSKGLLDMGSQARPLTSEEKKTYPNVQEIMFLKDALVIGVSSNVNVTSLSREQIRQIYSGNITDWSQVGGAPGKIIVLDREESDSSKILLRKEILGSDLNVVSTAILLHSAGDMNKALMTTKNTIGVSSYGVINADKLDIKMIAVDGVEPSSENIQNGKYTIVRMYGLTLPAGKLDDLTQSFVDYLFSEESTAKFRSSGYVPIERTRSN